jgi:hypothetical protein
MRMCLSDSLADELCNRSALTNVFLGVTCSVKCAGWYCQRERAATVESAFNGECAVRGVAPDYGKYTVPDRSAP